jgi:hypothetical protein
MEDVDKIYKTILTRVEKTLGSGVTYNTDLLQYGKDIFGKKFHGVYAADKLPKLTKTQPYAIINLDKSAEDGSHWVALAKTSSGGGERSSKSGDKIIFYDSFGRPNRSILPMLRDEGKIKILDTEDDAEQEIVEENCGARCITFLIMFDKFGEKIALQI